MSSSGGEAGSGGGGGLPGSAASSVASLPEKSPPSILDRVYFRAVAPTDLRPCHALEAASYPPDEAASLSTLQYRQHHAAKYFRCAVLLPEETVPTDSLKMSGKIVGFVTGTRCWDFDEGSLSTHDPRGPILAIHSVVVTEEHRTKGVGGSMLAEYVRAIRKMELNHPIDRIVLMAKADKLAFYVRAGFQVVGVSPIVHGKDVWYECSARVGGTEEENPTSAAGGAAAGAGALSSTVPLGLSGTSSGSRPCWIVDSFADPTRPGSGNPAAVVLCPTPGLREPVDWMRTVAAEFNLSETAFVWERQGEGGNSAAAAAAAAAAGAGGNGSGGEDCGADEISYAIRYYTRTGAEVDLCGHATLASASVLLQAAAADRMRRTEVKSVVFYARKDVLRAVTVATAKKGGDGSGGGSGSDVEGGGPSTSAAPNLRIAMDFPWRSVREVDAPADRTAVLNMLKAAFEIDAGGEAEGEKKADEDDEENRNILFLGIDSAGEDLLVELTPEAFGRVGSEDSSRVDISALGAWGGGYKRGVILCCRAGNKAGNEEEAGEVDFLSRFFGPKVGIDEDPVTGSAHCTLGPYFGAKVGRSRVVGRQASSRGGIVECVLKDGGEGGEGEESARRVGIIGTAVTTVTGTLHI